jgi:hypothetical protein
MKCKELTLKTTLASGYPTKKHRKQQKTAKNSKKQQKCKQLCGTQTHLAGRHTF